MEVTEINDDTDSIMAFGINCNHLAINEAIDDFYYFAITPAGEYAIAKSVGERSNDVFPTKNDQWAPSGLIARDVSSYRMGADCANGTMTLYVDGQQIDSVSDTTYSTGTVGAFTWSGKDVASADVTFDDFLVTSLEWTWAATPKRRFHNRLFVYLLDCSIHEFCRKQATVVYNSP